MAPSKPAQDMSASEIREFLDSLDLTKLTLADVRELKNAVLRRALLEMGTRAERPAHSSHSSSHASHTAHNMMA